MPKPTYSFIDQYDSQLKKKFGGETYKYFKTFPTRKMAERSTNKFLGLNNRRIVRIPNWGKGGYVVYRVYLKYRGGKRR